MAEGLKPGSRRQERIQQPGNFWLPAAQHYLELRADPENKFHGLPILLLRYFTPPEMMARDYLFGVVPRDGSSGNP
jgi:hypothetical protein